MKKNFLVLALTILVLTQFIGCGVSDQFGKLISQQGEVATKLYNHAGWKSKVAIRRENRSLGEVRVTFILNSVEGVSAGELYATTLTTVEEVFEETPSKVVIEVIDKPED